MKKILNVLLLTLITSQLSYSQRIVQNDLYTVVYSESYQQPLTLTYQYPFFKLKYIEANHHVMEYKYYGVQPVTYPNIIEVKVSKEFKAPTGIITSNDEDYKDNIYEKGHLVPKASFENDNDILDFLFSYLNCALMHETLNSGVWRLLEDYERNLYEDENVRVKVILSFSNNSKLVKGGATVPTHFTKIIEYGFSTFPTGDEEVTREVYTFPNDASVKGKKIKEFKMKHLSGKFITNE